MALKFKDGKFEITNAKDLSKALTKLREFQEDEEIQEAIAEAEALRRAAAHFMRANHIRSNNGYSLVQPHDKVWIVTDNELPSGDGLNHLRSLQDLLGDKRTPKRKGKKTRKVFNFVTKRVIDREKLDLAVQRGYITLEEIALALWERPNTPYVRRGKDTGQDAD